MSSVCANKHKTQSILPARPDAYSLRPDAHILRSGLRAPMHIACGADVYGLRRRCTYPSQYFETLISTSQYFATNCQDFRVLCWLSLGFMVGCTPRSLDSAPLESILNPIRIYIHTHLPKTPSLINKRLSKWFSRVLCIIRYHPLNITLNQLATLPSPHFHNMGWFWWFIDSLMPCLFGYSQSRISTQSLFGFIT